MAQYYTRIKNLNRAVSSSGGVAVDSRSAPVSR